MEADKTYHKVPFSAIDINQLNIKYPPRILRKKQTWALLLVPVLLFLFYGLVLIVLNHYLGSHKGQLQRLLSLLIYIPIILFIIILLKIQNTIDYRLGYKRVGLFKISCIINLGRAKLLLLNGWRIFRIDIYSPIFKEVQKSQFVQVEKTATNRLLYDISVID